MGTLCKIAWRNVWRHGKRTLLTVITMAFGLGLYIAMDSLLKGMDKGGLQNIVELTDSSVRISTKAYEEERRSSPLDYGLSDLAGLESFLLKDPRVVAVSARTRFIGQLSNGVDGIPVSVVALDPEQDSKVYSLPDYVDGSWFGQQGGNQVSASDTANAYNTASGSVTASGRAIVLGRGLAEDLGLKIGDWVVLSARTRYESQNADDFLISGLIDCSEPAINSSGVFVTLADAEGFLDLEGLRTEMGVRMKSRTNLKASMAESDEVAEAIRIGFPGLEAKSFGELGRQFLEIAKMKAKGAGVIIMVILLISGVGIANTVLMSVYSRVREIGVLRAFGLKPKEITRLFLIEGGIIGLIGSLGGVAFGVLIVTYFVKVGLSIDFMGREMAGGMPIWGTLYGEWNPGQMVVAAIFGVVVSLFASRSPARKAGKLEVTNALRFV